jgi:hypothetical protein
VGNKGHQHWNGSSATSQFHLTRNVLATPSWPQVSSVMASNLNTQEDHCVYWLFSFYPFQWAGIRILLYGLDPGLEAMYKPAMIRRL